MRKTVGLLGAGLLLLAGCAWKLGNTQVEAVVKVDEQAVDANLEATVDKVKAELQRRGLALAIAKEGDTYRVTGTTKSGERFTLLLSRVRLATGKEQTKVRIEWDKSPDRDLWLGLLAALAVGAVQGTP